MPFKVLLTKAALTDLGKIIDYIGDDSPDSAERFSKALLDHAELLSEFPHLGVRISARPRVRSLLHTPFRIYYRVVTARNLVEILHFWHTSRRPPFA